MKYLNKLMVFSLFMLLGHGVDVFSVGGGKAVALQEDEKIVVAGPEYSNFAVARYNVDGFLDPTFGARGRVTTNFGPYGVGNAVALQRDKKIVVAGSAAVARGLNFAVARYNADGSLDLTFGTKGKVTTSFGGGTFDRGNAMVLQKDGKIVVAGTTAGTRGLNFAVARYNTNGSLDTGFGTGGKVTTSFYKADRGYAVALQKDGKIVVAGTSDSNFAVARYNVDGSLDMKFGREGKGITRFTGLFRK